MPAPTWLSAPVPEMALPMVTASERLNEQGGVVDDVAGAELPVVPPVPICRVPAEMVVVPE